MMKFYSLEDFKRAHENKSKPWFRAGGFFGTRLCHSTFDYTTGLFVTSESGPGDSVRRYTIRRADFDTLGVRTVGEYRAYETRKQAISAMRKIC